MLAAFARRGLHRWKDAANEGPVATGAWVALHVGDAGHSECRFADAEVSAVMSAEAAAASARAA